MWVETVAAGAWVEMGREDLVENAEDLTAEDLSENLAEQEELEEEELAEDLAEEGEGKSHEGAQFGKRHGSKY